MNTLIVIYKYVAGEHLSREDLRDMLKLGLKGRAHQYAEHVYAHYNDHSYMSRAEWNNR